MRLEHVGLQEEGLVGRHQRQVLGIGQVDQPLLGLRLLGQAVAADLDVEAAGEEPGQLGQGLAGRLVLAGEQQAADRALGAAGQGDQALGMAAEIVPADLRHLAGVAFHVGQADQLQQVAVAGLVLRQQHDLVRRRLVAVVRRRLVAAQPDLAADDRLQAGIGGGQREFEGAEEVAAVGDGHGRHGPALTGGDQILELDRPFGERIGGMNAEVDEIGVWHGPVYSMASPSLYTARIDPLRRLIPIMLSPDCGKIEARPAP